MDARKMTFEFLEDCPIGVKKWKECAKCIYFDGIDDDFNINCRWAEKSKKKEEK